MKSKFFSRPPEPREPVPEAEPDYPEHIPQAFQGCICPPPFISGGEIFYPHSPSCLVPGHGRVHHPMPPVSVYFKDSRTVGIPKSTRRAIA